ncbi:MAG: PilZ domain-containing protein [Clostridiales bacterium]
MFKQNLKKNDKKIVKTKSIGEKKLNIVGQNDVVIIRHNKIEFPVLSIVSKVNRDFIYLKKSKELKEENIKYNDDIYINVMNSSYEYILICKIVAVQKSKEEIIKIKVIKTLKYKNRRKNKRYFVNFKSYINVENTNQKLYGIIKNISQNGVSVFFKDSIDISKVENVNVFIFPDEDINIDFKAKIVRVMSNGLFNEYGLELISISEKHKILYEELIDKLEFDQLAYIDEYLR